MLLSGFTDFSFTVKNSGAFRNVLEYLGVVVPHTGEPFTEALLFGIGGGIGAEYLTWSMKVKEKAGFYLRLWYKPLKVISHDDWFIPRVASRIGIKITVKHTSSRKKGEQTLLELLKGNKPVILFLPSHSIKDNTLLPYSAFSMGSSLAPCYCAVVTSFDEGTGRIQLADRSSHPVTTSMKELADPRAVMKHTAIAVEPLKELKNIKKAMKAGIRDCCQELLHNRMKNCRVEAFEVWAKRLSDLKDIQSWRYFSNEKLLANLQMVHSRIKYFLSSEGALRSIYADFLEEASIMMSTSTFNKVSLLYRDVANDWLEFGDAVFPDSISLFKKLRLIIEKQNKAFINRGLSDFEFRTMADNIRKLQNEILESWPLQENETINFFNQLSDYLALIYQKERTAIKALNTAID
ncbi:MAG: DUF4872 domain-containing protein [Candidatus Hodarchaeota archaeon]